MLWVLKRTVSMRRFSWAPQTYVKTDGLGNIHNFTSTILLIWQYGESIIFFTFRWSAITDDGLMGLSDPGNDKTTLLTYYVPIDLATE